MKILQVVNVRWFNATAWYGLHLSRLLADAGHEVRVLALPETECLARAEAMGLAPLALDLNTRNPLALPLLWQGMGRMVREFQPDIVNCHRGEGFACFAALKALGRGFALIRTRGDQRPPKGGAGNRFLHNVLADAVIATNSRTKKAFQEILHTPGVRMIVGGVDRQKFCFSEEGRRLFRSRYGFSDNERVVGLLGRFDRVKGQKELIEAVATLAGQGNSPVRLLLAGFPTHAVGMSDVQGWLSANGLGERAVITGKCDDVAGCISAMDLGVVASQGSEAIARAALEILSCGVPLVSTDIGVMPDLLPAWALTPPHDVPALAGLLRRGLFDEPFRNALRLAGEERISELDAPAFLQQTLAVYADALKGRGLPRNN